MKTKNTADRAMISLIWTSSIVLLLSLAVISVSSWMNIRWTPHIDPIKEWRADFPTATNVEWLRGVWKVSGEPQEVTMHGQTVLRFVTVEDKYGQERRPAVSHDFNQKIGDVVEIGYVTTRFHYWSTPARYEFAVPVQMESTNR